MTVWGWTKTSSNNSNNNSNSNGNGNGKSKSNGKSNSNSNSKYRGFSTALRFGRNDSVGWVETSNNNRRSNNCNRRSRFPSGMEN